MAYLLENRSIIEQFPLNLAVFSKYSSLVNRESVATEGTTMAARSIVLIGILALSACGGAGSQTIRPFAASFSYGELANQNDDLPGVILSAFNTYGALDPSSDVTPGSATYLGPITVTETVVGNPGAEYQAVGEFRIDAEFSSTASTLSGIAGNFFEMADPNAASLNDTTGSSIDGTITMNGAGEFEGTLTKLDGEVATYGMDLVPGNLRLTGDDGQYLAGTFVGSSSALGRTDSIAAGAFYGDKQ